MKGINTTMTFLHSIHDSINMLEHELHARQKKHEEVGKIATQ
jgi:hypothetical protein